MRRMRIVAQTKRRRERERERKRRGKGRGRERRKGKGYWKWSWGRNGKSRNCPSRESNRGSQQTQLMLYHWATERNNITSEFEILSALPPLHNIGIIQCPQLTNPLCSGDPSRSNYASRTERIVNWIKAKNAFCSANEMSKGEGKRRGANAQGGNRARDPSKRGWCSTSEPPRQATSPARWFEIWSTQDKR